MQLEEWWLNSAYLEVRFSSQLNVNFGGPAPYLEHYWPPKAGTQLERTSIAVWFTLLYWDLIRTPRRDDRDCSAVAKHNKLMNEAQHGKEGLPVYGLYNDPACTKSGGGGHFVLSTSLVGCTTGLGGVVPRVHHGYGFFYRIRDDRIVVACTAWKSCPETDADKFFQNLSKSFHVVLQLLALSQL